MLKKRIIFILFWLGPIICLNAQTDLEYLIEDAEFHMEERDYQKAFELYQKISKKEPSNVFWKFQSGICALNLADRKGEAIDIFQKVLKEEPNEARVKYYLGRAYHANYKFEEAIKYFDEYLASGESKEKEEAEHYKLSSEFGMKITRTMVDADLRNLGEPLNTPDDEYVPCISADESVLIYTYRGIKSKGGLLDRNFKPDKEGTYYEDVYISKKDDTGVYSNPSPISDYINTLHHDAAVGISPDGQMLFTFSSDKKDGGDLYVCHLMGDTWSAPQKMKGDVNTKYWEGSCSITADGKNLFFASERPGGFGGRDLYMCVAQKDGTWGKAINLGPGINTKYDEDDPFIHPDGITLFFSSKGHNSIGGYDIFYSIKKDNDWIEPLNMGFPLNTTDDDRYYVITAKGDKGYFSSNRILDNGKGGNGSQDLYMVTPGIIGEKPVLAMVKGLVFGNDKPIEANIEIIKKSTNEIIGPFHSNAKSGKYLVALSPGENYTFRIKAETYPEYNEDLDIEKITKYLEIRKDFHLAKDGYIDPHLDTLKKMNDLMNQKPELDTIKTVMQQEKIIKDTVYVYNNTPKTDTTKATTQPVVTNNPKLPCDEFKTLDFNALKNKSLNDPSVYAKLLAIGSKICAPNMIFKVQIAAYRHPENYKWDHLKEFGNPDIQNYPDGITRFTQQQFTSIHDAETLRQQIIAKGQKDAWITGFIDGKRFTLEELIMVDFFNKNLSQFNENLQELLEYASVK